MMKGARTLLSAERLLTELFTTCVGSATIERARVPALLWAHSYILNNPE